MTDIPDFDALTAERAALKAGIDQATDRVKEIDGLIRDHHGYGVYEYAGLRVGVEKNRRLDADKFRNAYPIDRHPTFYKVTVTPDTAAIKDHIAPAELDPFYDEGQPIVRVR